MKRNAVLRRLLVATAALSLISTGCGKAKDALKEALGFDSLSSKEIEEIKTQVGWDEAANPNLKNFTFHGGFKLTDKFKGDLSKDVTIPVPFEIKNESAQNTASNQRSMVLLRAEKISVDASTEYTRFRIITVARYEASSNELVIDGKVVNQYLDENQIVSVANKNQEGSYVLVEGKGNKGLSYLTGVVRLKKDGVEQQTEVKDSLVFTSSSPFVTVTGSTGKYFLAMIEGSKGTVIAYKQKIPEEATGTPVSTSKGIAYAGLLDGYKDKYNEKVGKLGNASASAKGAELFDKVNTKVTDFLNAWKLIEMDLLFVQPKQTPPTPPSVQEPAPATPPTPEPAPAPANVVIRRSVETPATWNYDLGCAGFTDANVAIPLVRDGKYFDDYQNHPGWRATGDVRYAYELADKIFPAVTGNNYLDKSPGYCVLTTGDQDYQLSKLDTSYLPGPNGLGQTSEMWQKLKVPAEAKSIQVRVAFFSTEFPQFVGTAFNDSFFVKFDESPDFIASGNLNDLAGSSDQTASCSTLNGSNLSATCGEWKFVGANKDLHGQLWSVESSSQAPAAGKTFQCLPNNASNEKCYHGMIESRIICKDLTAQDQGKDRTLRFNVTDAGDSFFDSALVVDSVAFSKELCSSAAGRMTPETLSRVSQLQ